MINLSSTQGDVINLYAQWTPITYEVKYNANGGTGSMSNSTHTYDVAKNLTENAFKRTGYVFSGWSTNADGSGTKYADKASVINLSSTQDDVINLYAVWTPITYEVKYNANGGTGTMSNSTHTYDVAKNLTTNAYTRTGYTFAGWATSANGSVVYKDKASVINLSSTQDAVINLYAVWTPITYEVKYNANGGTGSMSNSTHTYDIRKALSANKFSRTGYIFAGWATASTSSVAYADKASVVNLANTQGAIIDLYAVWTPITYTIVYNPNPPTGMSYTGTMNASTHTYDESKTLTTNTYAVEHYTFLGWAYSPNSTTVEFEDGESVKNLANTQDAVVNLYAVWDPVVYKITCTQMGGSGGTSIFYQTYNEKFSLSKTGEAITTITVPTRQGYVFAGYYTGTAGNGDMIVDAGGTITVSPTYFKADTYIYAYWLKLDIELTEVVLKYKGTDGKIYEIQNLKSVPLGTTVYVYHTYKNSSNAGVYYFGSYDSNGVYRKGNEYNMTRTVTGYHNSSSGKLTPDYELGAGESVTILAGSFTPSVGKGTVTGFVYQSDHNFADASDEYSAANNTMSVTYAVTFDMELVEIYLTNKDGTRLSERWIAVGQEVYVHHVYRNNSSGAVTADLYRNGVKYGTITLAANSTQDVIAGIYTQATNGAVDESGGIYRKGYTASTEKYETDLDNNKKSISVIAIVSPTIEVIDVDCALRAGTDVFTSFEITNSDIIAFPSDDMLTVTMYIYNASGHLIKMMEMETVVPAEEKQLVWFRWTVPDDGGPYTIKGVLSASVYAWTFDECTASREVVSSQYVATPDTQYEESRPGDWVQPAKPAATTGSITWYTWSYNTTTNQFVKTNYGISVSGGTVTITPNSETAYKKYGNWYMKSGYGFSLEATDATISNLPEYTMPDAEDYTNVQWSYALFPEFMYKTSYCTTVEQVNNMWQFWEMDIYGRKHFTPIWYPDSTGTGDMYYVRLLQTEIWTPMGVVTVEVCSNGIYIDGNMYDDWYIS